jgi:hypothetical protein
MAHFRASFEWPLEAAAEFAQWSGNTLLLLSFAFQCSSSLAGSRREPSLRSIHRVFPHTRLEEHFEQSVGSFEPTKSLQLPDQRPH